MMTDGADIHMVDHEPFRPHRRALHLQPGAPRDEQHRGPLGGGRYDGGIVSETPAVDDHRDQPLALPERRPGHPGPPRPGRPPPPAPPGGGPRAPPPPGSPPAACAARRRPATPAQAGRRTVSRCRSSRPSASPPPAPYH